MLEGDVYFRRGAQLELAYADWHCDAKRDEPRAEYVTRSLGAAGDYIRRFPDREGVISVVVNSERCVDVPRTFCGSIGAAAQKAVLELTPGR